MHTHRPRHLLHLCFLLALFVLFAIGSLLIVLFGADAYHKTVKHIDQDYETRILTTYLNEKIRQTSNQAHIYTASHQGVCILVIQDEYKTPDVQTCLYAYKNVLREQTVSSLDQFSFASGDEILKVKQFEAEYQNETLLKLQIYDKNNHMLVLYINTNLKN